jgi:hypothetical protein
LLSLLGVMASLQAAPADGRWTTPEARQTASQLHYLNTSFENASPLYWEIAPDGSVQIFLVYDQERDSPNRANGHWHFQVQAQPGAKLTLVLNHLRNIWNGQLGNPASKHTVCRVSEDGRHWNVVPTELLTDYRLRFTLEIPASGALYVAHVEPYRVSDLERLLAEIRNHPRVALIPIGRTVQGRPLSIIRVGSPDAPHSVLLRARAHPWESGGNWVVQGLIRSLLRDEPANQKYLARYTVYVLPMANMDGVANGWTRFNQLGMDLNRKWDRPADPKLAPENHALEAWLRKMIEEGRKPDLAMDLHNDQYGQLHISRPNIQLDAYLARMDRYEALLRRYTWFTESRTGGSFHNPGSFGEGLLERFGITAFVQELNANWIAGLDDYATGKNWELLGAQYREVFYRYFAAEDGENAAPAGP